MQILRYGGRYSAAIKKLAARGLLPEYPTQVETSTSYKDGVDITFRFRNFTPKMFEANRELLLEAAYAEGRRYEKIEDTVRFTQVDVSIKMPRKIKWETKTYTAAKHTDSEIMVYGPGYEAFTTFLVDVMDRIEDVPARYNTKQYKIVKMVVSIRDKRWAFKVDEAKAEAKDRAKEGTL